METKTVMLPPMRKAYPLLPSTRLFFYLFGTATTTIMVGTYSSMNFAWVCMVNDTALNLNASGYDGDIAWGKDEQKVVFSAYNFGGVIAFVLPGYLIDRLGPRRVGGVAILIGSISVGCVPVLAYVSYWAVTAARAITGFCGSFAWPLVFSLTSHWAPKAEIGRAILIAATGFPGGQCIDIAMAGVECSRLGWVWVFYLIAMSGVTFSVLWFLVFRQDPEDCSWISEAETEYIVLNRDRKTKKQSVIPWKSIMKSVPVWACMACYLSMWQFVFFVGGFGPTFLKEVLKVSVESNGVFSAIPQIGFMLGRWTSGFASDLNFGSLAIRTKICNSIFAFGGALFCLGLSFVREDSGAGLAVGLMWSLLFCNGFATGGYQKCIVLMAPQFSGIIGSLIGVIGSSGAMVMPYLIAALTEHGTAEEWSHVFYYLAATGTFSGTVFFFFGSSELQEWAKPVPHTLGFSTIHAVPLYNSRFV